MGHEHPHDTAHAHHEHEHEHEHEHPPGDHHGHTHDHGRPHDHGHPHDHEHAHAGGVRGFVLHLLVPHTHDAADSIDDALEASSAGVRALKVSLFVLLGTTVLQLVAVIATSSVALLADTVHNFSDALTAVPLWIAFVLARRPPSRRYTYGFGRAEDLAGLFIVAVVLLSAVVAGWQSIDRLIHPRTPENLGWLAVAGVIGFLGNEAVAVYRIRVGRRIGSAALVADGVHARTDGFTSLAVVVGALGVALGLPLADPIVGILISVAILVLLLGTVRSIGRRLLDGIDPDLVATADHALRHVEGVLEVRELRLRWIGHRLEGDAEVQIAAGPASDAQRVADDAERSARHHLGQLDRMRVRTVVGG